MIEISVKGGFAQSTNYLARLKNQRFEAILNRCGEKGVSALRSGTPKDTGETAGAWSYKIERSGTQAKIVWTNSHVHDGVNIAVILQYGHGTRFGGYVPGRDYINPAIRPVFDQLVNESMKEVSKL